MIPYGRPYYLNPKISLLFLLPPSFLHPPHPLHILPIFTPITPDIFHPCPPIPKHLCSSPLHHHCFITPTIPPSHCLPAQHIGPIPPIKPAILQSWSPRPSIFAYYISPSLLPHSIFDTMCNLNTYCHYCHPPSPPHLLTPSPPPSTPNSLTHLLPHLLPPHTATNTDTNLSPFPFHSWHALLLLSCLSILSERIFPYGVLAFGVPAFGSAFIPFFSGLPGWRLGFGVRRLGLLSSFLLGLHRSGVLAFGVGSAFFSFWIAFSRSLAFGVLGLIFCIWSFTPTKSLTLSWCWGLGPGVDNQQAHNVSSYHGRSRVKL